MQHKPTKCTLFELIFQFNFLGLELFYMFRTSWFHPQEDSCKVRYLSNTLPTARLLTPMHANLPYKSAFYSCLPDDEPKRFETWRILQQLKNWIKVDLKSVNFFGLCSIIISQRRSQQPRGLRRRSSAARLLRGSNPTGGMDVCLLWLLCVVR